MYGNNVRLSDAVGCYKACNGRHQSSVETELRAWYHVRVMEVNPRHMEQYYSMPLKCLSWIKEKALEQYEVVNPFVKFSRLGRLRAVTQD
jgi:hypothetical protein